MSEPGTTQPTGDCRVTQPERGRTTSALFASLVLNQAQMALMFLGRMPHPETGQTVRDLEAARLFIDQLEMLEQKTRGNLDEQERRALRDNLTMLHMAFVEAAQEAKGAGPASAEPAAAGSGDAATEVPKTGQPISSPEADSRKKFSKKY